MTRGFSLIKVGYGLLLGVTGILHIFRLVLEMKAGKEIPASSRLEFFENFRQTTLLYQMAMTTPLGHYRDEV